MNKPLELSPLLADDDDIALIITAVFEELARAEEKFPGWPDDFLIGDQIINEEKGEATKALLDTFSGKTNLKDVRAEYVQTAAMCIRQMVAIDRYYGLAKEVDSIDTLAEFHNLDY